MSFVAGILVGAIGMFAAMFCVGLAVRKGRLKRSADDDVRTPETVVAILNGNQRIEEN